MALEGTQGGHVTQSLHAEPRTSLRAGQIMTGEVAMDDTNSTEGQARSRFAGARAGATAVGGNMRRSLNGFNGLNGLNSRQVRAGALLGSVGLLVLSVLLAPFGIAPWWSPVLWLLVTAGVVAWLRKSALEARAARPSHHQPVHHDAPVHEPVRHEPVRHEARVPQQRRSGLDVAAPAPVVAARESFFDGQAATSPQPTTEQLRVTRPTESSTASTASTAEPADGSWAPVAVPPPTYTLKAKASRPAVEPAPTSGGLAAAYEPVDQLPFDGLALDEDLEELPSVYRAG